MTDLEYINHFFSSPPSAEEKQLFERRVAEDPAFAEEVAFFLNTMQTARTAQITERKNQFRALYDQNRKTPPKITSFRKIAYALAAAATLAAVIFSYTIWFKPVPARQLVGQYVKVNLRQLPVKMGGPTQDSLQTGLGLYNQGKFDEAGKIFESLLQTDSLNGNAKKYAGIVYLQLGNYDKALVSFRQLENIPGLYANPGKFYQALTLIQRSGPGDVATAKELLKQIIAQNLEGSEKAKEWLPHF